MSLNFCHSACSPHCQTPDPLDYENPLSTSKKVDVCQILLKIEAKIALSAGCRTNGLPTL
jgi:hypothetical protein